MPKKKEHSAGEHKKGCDEDIENLLNEVEKKEEEHKAEEERVEEEEFSEEE